VIEQRVDLLPLVQGGDAHADRVAQRRRHGGGSARIREGRAGVSRCVDIALDEILQPNRVPGQGERLSEHLRSAPGAARQVKQRTNIAARSGQPIATVDGRAEDHGGAGT